MSSLRMPTLPHRRSSASSEKCQVVLVMRADAPAGNLAISETKAAANGGAVAVVLPLQVHGYSFGLPNPGLMPTARERATAQTAIAQTVRRLEKLGIEADGEIVVSRHAAKAVDRVARRRNAAVVIVEQLPANWLRRFVEGDVRRQLSRRLAGTVVVRSAAG